MKSVIKIALRPFWNLAAPIRRPIARKIEDWFFAQIEPRARKLSAEIVPGLDGLLREMERLQFEIDRLQNALVTSHLEASIDTERAKAG